MNLLVLNNSNKGNFIFYEGIFFNYSLIITQERRRKKST